MFIIIYSNRAIDLYTIKVYSLEHKQCYNIVIGKEKHIFLHFTTSPQGDSMTCCIKLWFHRLKIQSKHNLFMAFGSTMIVTLGRQQYNVIGERSTTLTTLIAILGHQTQQKLKTILYTVQN